MAQECSNENDASSDKPENQTIENQPNEPEPTECKGWLIKRSKISHKWKKKWFHLKNSTLSYGNSEQNTPKKIQLENAEIAESDVDKKQYAFSIRPKNIKRTYYIMAQDESTQSDWMHAICYARVAGSRDDQSQACVLQ